jgi:hypothetical protein
MARSTDDLDQVFVLRFWKETGGTSPVDRTQWRARISHINMNNKYHVVGCERALAIVRLLMREIQARDGREV